jgi:hypothetical protein
MADARCLPTPTRMKPFAPPWRRGRSEAWWSIRGAAVKPPAPFSRLPVCLMADRGCGRLIGRCHPSPGHRRPFGRLLRWLRCSACGTGRRVRFATPTLGRCPLAGALRPDRHLTGDGARGPYPAERAQRPRSIGPMTMAHTLNVPGQSDMVDQGRLSVRLSAQHDPARPKRRVPGCLSVHCLPKPSNKPRATRNRGPPH